MELPTISAT